VLGGGWGGGGGGGGEKGGVGLPPPQEGVEPLHPMNQPFLNCKAL
jgi:hypothetical protein